MVGVSKDVAHLFGTLWCCCSVAKSCLSVYNPMDWVHHAALSLILSRSVPNFMSIESMILSSHRILWNTVLTQNVNKVEYLKSECFIDEIPFHQEKSKARLLSWSHSPNFWVCLFKGAILLNKNMVGQCDYMNVKNTKRFARLTFYDVIIIH